MPRGVGERAENASREAAEKEAQETYSGHQADNVSGPWPVYCPYVKSAQNARMTKANTNQMNTKTPHDGLTNLGSTPALDKTCRKPHKR